MNHVARFSLDRWLIALTRAVSLLSCILLPGCASKRFEPASPNESAFATNRFEFTQPQMGVPFRIVLYARDAATASNTAHAAFSRIAALNQIMSDYEEDSELTLLSRTAGSGRAVPVSDDLWRVLQTAQAWSRRSEGAFDITVGPVVQLWRRARRQQELPDPTKLEHARRAVGYQKLVLNETQRTATLSVPGMRLDLGGIAKGYAVDAALEVLRFRGITRALVSGGGDLAVSDPPPGKRGWRIEVAPLDATNAPPSRYVLLKHCALSTSGDLYQHVEIDGKRYSHVVDPRTGIGLTDHNLVTVIARDGTTAETLAKSTGVLGPIAGLKLVEATPGAAAYVMRQPAAEIETLQSKRFGRFVETPAEAPKPSDR